MQLSLNISKEHYYITAYTEGEITVNDAVFNQSIIVSQTRLLTNWRPRTIADLQIEDCQIILDLQPNIVLLGTGDSLVFPDTSIVRFFNQHRIGIEFMDNSAACRTYDVLLSEARNVAAGFLIKR